MAVRVVLLLLALSSSTEGSFKKGMCAYPNDLLCDDFKVLDNISWWYDWEMDMSFYHNKVGQHCTGTTKLVPKHIPMVRLYHLNETQLHLQTWGRWILGFNEPDLEEKADMSAQEAAAAWPEIEKAAPHYAKLVSPSTSAHDFNWYDEFFRLCNNCKIDFIAAHIYKCDANEIMYYLQQLYNRYNKKIWLTEFACPITNDENQQLHLMKTLLPQLEAADYVFRYAWYSARIPENQNNTYVTNSASLLQQNSSALTTLGQFYNSYHVRHDYSHIIG